MNRFEYGQLYFDDLTMGMSDTSPGRTITESDVVSFAGLSGDFNALHTDVISASQGPYGGRVAHGMLVLSVISGLATRTSLYQALQSSVLALLEVNCQWPNPTKIGDTIRAVVTVTDMAKTSKIERGVVTFERRGLNQDQDEVAISKWKLLVRRAPMSIESPLDTDVGS